MSYGERNIWKERGKFVVFLLGHIFGFGQPMLAAIVGCIIFFTSWMIIPGAFDVFLAVPFVAHFLQVLKVTAHHLTIANWVMVGIGTFLGVCCWCRVAVLCNPNVFDRYKIRLK